MQTHELTANAETLMRQAGMTANEYFHAAKETLVNSGMKFTASDVIELAKIAASDYNSAMVLAASNNITEGIFKFCDVFDNGIFNISNTVANILDK